MHLKVSIQEQIVTLIKLTDVTFNRKTNWKGAWSNNGEEWTKLDAEIRNCLVPKNNEEVTFWISLTDFFLNFFDISICTLKPFDDKAQEYFSLGT